MNERQNILGKKERPRRQINEDFVVYKNTVKHNSADSVILLAWQCRHRKWLVCWADTETHCGSGKRNRTSTLKWEWKSCMCALSFQKAIIYLIQSTTEKSIVAFSTFFFQPQINKGHNVLYDKGLLEILSQHAGLYTHLESHGVSHTCWVCRMICLLKFPLLWFLFQDLNQRGRGLVVGEAGVVRGGEGKGPLFRGTAVWRWRSAQG